MIMSLVLQSTHKRQTSDIRKYHAPVLKSIKEFSKRRNFAKTAIFFFQIICES